MSEPEVIAFKSGGDWHMACVGLPLDRAPRSGEIVPEYHGQKYVIFISLGSIPGYPGIGVRRTSGAGLTPAHFVREMQ